MVFALSLLMVILSFMLIVLILLHRGKGGGLSDMFGGGFSSSYAGSSTVQRFLNQVTIYVGILWFFTIVAIGLKLKSG
ncbi:MAG: preprotein translocase subunit SecG [Frankiaceae bacterium]|nr:preprotein translocase subunit SecG [Frankiaceae bacterium]MDQ1727515.1 preprotein translocase subunit SecG [Frankiaceae bacterium]